MSIVFARVEPRRSTSGVPQRRTRPRLRVLLEGSGRKRKQLGSVPLPANEGETAWFFMLVDNRLADAGVGADERPPLLEKVRQRLVRESRPKPRAKRERLRALALQTLQQQEHKSDEAD